MTPERFWDLVATLGGVADDTTCERLDEQLRASGEGQAFNDHLEGLVQRLARECRWPADMGGDSVEWVAAAVVAAGRPAYDAVLASGEVDPGHWEWDEAEALLVAGYDESDEDRASGPPPDHGSPLPPVDVTLQWLSVPSPEGMQVPDDHMPEMVIDLGDDPTMGRKPVHDPDWVAAQQRLAADPDFVERRARLAHLDLGLTVRPWASDGDDAPAASVLSLLDSFLDSGTRGVREATAYRFDTGERPAVVLCVPVTDFPESGSRVDGYVAAVHRLVEEASA